MLFIRHANKSYTFNPDLMQLMPNDHQDSQAPALQEDNHHQKVELQVDTDSPTTASTEYGLQIFGFYIYTT
ncbi:hypothetical protein DB41_BO00030 [Neochlamydia sp. TUME1]|uniref:hypothetical protein n=1 Tax=Neochlamydia sp. TUME1 TaxID=1478174 RepID=UPI00057EE8BF|nr:hypothetical protein [Neochlamydia sp. TUME1]KIC71310.1 hypothetical protein DB41_BO00030 [Neochlamydia sp. TUME1]